MLMIAVTKMDGRTEPFVPEKIVVSMVKTGAPAEYARTAAQGITKAAAKGITTGEIKTKVLAMLRAENPAWEKNWALYDAAVKKRSG